MGQEVEEQKRQEGEGVQGPQLEEGEVQDPRMEEEEL